MGLCRLTAGSRPVANSGHDSASLGILQDLANYISINNPKLYCKYVNKTPELLAMQSVEKMPNMDEPTTMQSQETTPGSKPVRRELPGINAPLSKEAGDWSLFGGIEAGYFDIALPLMVRERVMLGVMAALKDKRNWEEKVFDPVIVTRWRSEALAASRAMLETEQQTPAAESSGEEDKAAAKAKSIEFEIEHLSAPARQRVVTEKLFDYVSRALIQKG